MTAMSSITDEQFESILLRLEGGESMASVQADFPELEADIAALQDLQDFFAAQRTVVKPNPQGLKSVLRQVDLLTNSPEDESTWGSFFTAFGRYTGVVLPAVLVLGVSGYMWQSQLPSVPENEEVSQEVAFLEADSAPMARSMMAPASMMMAESMPAPKAAMNTNEMDMEALAKSLSEEFASDMAEFESTKESLEPLFTEQLFSYKPTPTL